MLWLSSSKEVDAETVDETMDSPPQAAHYEELVEVNSCAVAKLNLNRPAKEQAELSKSKLDECFFGQSCCLHAGVCRFSPISTPRSLQSLASRLFQ